MAGEEFDELNKARTNRAGAWILVVVGLFGAGFGLWHWHANASDVFQTSGPAFESLDQIAQDKDNAMKSKDTDGDGLSDYDETYVYHTSPYLKDTDGDGIDDKAEIRNGTNPNCPEGKQCGPLGGGTITLSTSDTSTDAASVDAAQSQAVQDTLNPTPEQIRTILREQGVPDSQLSGIDDATLIQMYQQSLQEAQQNQAAAPAASPPTSP